MKMAPILAAMRGREGFRPRLIHTGQHFSPEMSDAFFRELEMPEPDINLEVGGGTATAQTAEIMRRLESLFAADRPVAVVVVGRDFHHSHGHCRRVTTDSGSARGGRAAQL